MIQETLAQGGDVQGATQMKKRTRLFREPLAEVKVRQSWSPLRRASGSKVVMGSQRKTRSGLQGHQKVVRASVSGREGCGRNRAWGRIPGDMK